VSKKPSHIRTAYVVRWIYLAASLILLISLGCCSEYPFGTKVLPTDADVGRPIYDISAKVSVDYWDIGTPGYDESDPVYLHIAPQGCTVTHSGDVRLTSFEDHPAGSKITPEDADSDKTLTPLAATINYLNLHGGQAYDLEDPVYMHQSNCNYDAKITCQDGSEVPNAHPNPNLKNLYQNKDADANVKDDFNERLPYRDRGVFVVGARCITFTDNYKLLISDQFIDCVPEVAGVWQGLCVEVIHGLKADYYHVLGTWLVKISPIKISDDGYLDQDACGGNNAFSATQFICTNDIRLSCADELAAGTKVVDFDPDQNKLVAFPALVSIYGTCKDMTRIRYFDVNGDGVYDYPDDVYLNFPESEEASSVAVNNLRLSGPVS
jgi:hypothetical protein